MRITITTTKVDERAGTSPRTGRPYNIRTQAAQGETSRFRQPVRITLGSEQDPYEPGEYEMSADDNFVIGRYGDIEVVRIPVLKRVASAPVAAPRSVAARSA